MSKSLTPRYYPIRKVVYYQAIHRQARPGRPACLLGSLSTLTPACSPGLVNGGGSIGCFYNVSCAESVSSFYSNFTLYQNITSTFASCLASCDSNVACMGVSFNEISDLCIAYNITMSNPLLDADSVIGVEDLSLECARLCWVCAKSSFLFFGRGHLLVFWGCDFPMKPRSFNTRWNFAPKAKARRSMPKLR
jgi:hypothetical protein